MEAAVCNGGNVGAVVVTLTLKEATTESNRKVGDGTGHCDKSGAPVHVNETLPRNPFNDVICIE